MEIVLIMISDDWYDQDNHNDHTYKEKMLITRVTVGGGLG